MSKYKIMIVSWHFPKNEDILNIYKRMTPGCSGKWGNIEATLNPDEADFFVVIDGYKGKMDNSKAIYFGQHPFGKDTFVSASHRDFKDTPCLLAFPLNKYFNLSEVWIDYTYDELIKLQPPKKIKDLVCIVTYQTHKLTYTNRIRFLHEFCPKYPNIALYGRPSKLFKEDNILNKYYMGYLGDDTQKMVIGSYVSGKNILINYRYSLEFDLGKTYNYVTERFNDALLLWTMPIYFGSDNVEKFFPTNCFRYVDIFKEDLTEEINNTITTINSDFREEHIKDIAEARDLILNKYHTFAKVHEIINNLDKYKKEQGR